MPIARLSLTDFKAKIPRGAREKTLKKAMAADDIMGKWSATAWAKKIKAREVRKNMTDFDRFKLMLAKKRRSKEVKGTSKPAKKAAAGKAKEAAGKKGKK